MEMWELLDRLHRTLMLFDTAHETKEMNDLNARVVAALDYADAYQTRKGFSPPEPPPPGQEAVVVSDKVSLVQTPDKMIAHTMNQVESSMARANELIASVLAKRDAFQRAVYEQRAKLLQQAQGTTNASNPGVSE